MITSKLGIGPMSPNCIEAVTRYANENSVELMLIATRRQVECEEFGAGYVENFTTRGFADFVRDRDTGHKVLICRDHGGPYQGNAEVNLEADMALERALLSMKRDVEAGFDLIHVDCGYHTADVREATAYLIKEVRRHANIVGRSIEFEVGTEENVGRSTDPDKFQKDLEFTLKLVEPEFVVGQTGSLIKEVFQVGSFDCQPTRNLAETAHLMGVKFKEHNADYLDDLMLSQRTAAGVDAINVAPEFGVVQTRVVTVLANRFCLFDELAAFQRRALESEKWCKWMYGPASDALKAEIAGHYCFTSDEYRELVERLRAETDVDEAIDERLTALIDHYVRGMS